MILNRAEQFFEEIISQKSVFDFLSDLAAKSSSIEECDWLDFKEAGFLDKEKDSDAKLKKTWSENLGAFANTSGGVLIWGIKTTGRVAAGTSLAADAPQLGNRLRELQNNAVDPPVSGVQVRAFTKSTDSTEGFVVCFIPASSFPPHRTLWAEREYYFRVADSNLQIPTAILRRMFYRHTQPFLVPIVHASLSRGDDGNIHLQMRVEIANRGTASAEEICVKIIGAYKPCLSDAWEWRSDRSHHSVCRHPIHPQQTIPFLHNLTTTFHHEIIGDDHAVFDVEFMLFSKHAEAMVSKLLFTSSELRQSGHHAIVREGNTSMYH